ncbi:uncharacterized protein LOC115964292 [Quercus lobata]|uniref:uncharacterized protein LOC115964292 n=1 Tax=Quercus lobata TaxID=97700 RepID=UPI00124592D8|nr:uncharacterized protein LOC115964292 [Quercus lobata]
MGLGLTWHDVVHLYECHHLDKAGYYLKSRSEIVRLISCLSKSNKSMKDDFLIASGEWSDSPHCPTRAGDLDVGHSIRACSPRLARIDVSKLRFLARDDLRPIVLLGIQNPQPAVQLLPQDNPEVAACVEEESESSRLSLEDEIDKFYFEEDILKAALIELSDVEGEQDRNSVVSAPLIIACSENSSDEEVDNMASNKGKSLRELIATRGKGQSSKALAKSQISILPPTAPQIPANVGLKANPDLKKKRPVESLKEGEIAQKVFVVEEWCRDNRKLADIEALSRAEVEKSLGALKQEHHELSKKLKEAESGRKSVEAGLKIAEKQAEDQRQKLYKAQEEARLAKEAVQLVKEVAEAEKRVAYQLGAEETEAILFEELLEVCRDYCSISWAQALNAAGIPADSTLRLSENVFFPPEIWKILADTTEASEQPMVVPVAIPLVEIVGESSQVAVSVKDLEEEKGKGKGKGKKPSSKAKDLAKETITEAGGHEADPKAKDVPPP